MSVRVGEHWQKGKDGAVGQRVKRILDHSWLCIMWSINGLYFADENLCELTVPNL